MFALQNKRVPNQGTKETSLPALINLLHIYTGCDLPVGMVGIIPPSGLHVLPSAELFLSSVGIKIIPPTQSIFTITS